MVYATVTKAFMANLVNVKEKFTIPVKLKIVVPIKMTKFAVDVELANVEFVIVTNETIHEKFFMESIANVTIFLANEIMKNW